MQEATCAKNELAAANRMRREMQQKLTSVQEYIQQMLNARQEIESRFYAMKDDLMTRLHLACAARDEARGQVSTGVYNKAVCFPQSCTAYVSHTQGSTCRRNHAP